MVAKANIKAPMPSVSLVINNNKFILSDVIDIILIWLELQGLATASEALIN